ncbi:unnamed protein product, partial [Prunus brigantina]
GFLPRAIRLHHYLGAVDMSHKPTSTPSFPLLFSPQARLEDPIYGCVLQIFVLQQQVNIDLFSDFSLQDQVAQSFLYGSAVDYGFPLLVRLNLLLFLLTTATCRF